MAIVWEECVDTTVEAGEAVGEAMLGTGHHPPHPGSQPIQAVQLNIRHPLHSALIISDT